MPPGGRIDRLECINDPGENRVFPGLVTHSDAVSRGWCDGWGCWGSVRTHPSIADSNAKGRDPREEIPPFQRFSRSLSP